MSVTDLRRSPSFISAEAREHRADALLILGRAKLLVVGAFEAGMAELGIDKGDMSAARARSDGRMTRAPAPTFTDPLTTDRAWRSTEPHTRSPAEPKVYAPHGRRGQRPTRSRPVGEDGKLRCVRCGLDKIPEEFRLRSDRLGSGTRRSACDDCTARDQRARYLSVRTRADLNAVGLTFSVEDGDDVAGLTCLRCGNAITSGDDVTAGPVEVSHAGVCPA